MAALSSLLLLGSALHSSAEAATSRPASNLQYVDTLVGTANGGHAFAGATLPYGMAKAVADVDGDDNTGGFAYGAYNITGFSHMHDSGTGGQPSLGQFPLFPFTGCPDDQIADCPFSKDARKMGYRNGSLKHSPGYFGLTLDNGIAAEMTVTHHAALYRFQFPADGESQGPIMLLDLTDLADSRQNATVKVDPASGRIVSSGTFLPSFGNGQFKSYACADFQGAAIRDTGIYVSDSAGTYPKEIFVERGINLFYIESGGFVRFHKPQRNSTILARVGVSLVSSDQACRNAERELPDWNFAATQTAAEAAWTRKLGNVNIRPGAADQSLLKTFYSGLYRNMISPQDYSGERPLWQSNEPYYDSFYCIWDSFRAQHPLLTIIDPTAQSRMIRSLLDTYKHGTGWLPDCRMSLSKGFTQGGSNADVLMADAYVKKLPGIDWNLAYEAVVKDAEVEPLDWSNEGRGGLRSWKRLNYIPSRDFDFLGFGTNSRSISRTLEYAYNDFCVATLAKALDRPQDYEKYLARSSNWRNIFKADQTSFINETDTGFTGFFQPKYQNGTWGFMAPSECAPLDKFCSLTSNRREVFEDSIWTYNFFVPQDQAALIVALGGPETFVKRLDYLHEFPGLTDIGNEPTFLTCFLYHYAGRPALSAERIHTYVPSFFNATVEGLPGNDDSGAMGAFAAFAMMGLFPNPGQDVYLINPPFFEALSFKHPLTGKTATIRNVNFDASYKNIYIQSAKLNGKPYTKNWIGHEFFLQGQTLELVLGARESRWGTRPGDLPPSLGPAGRGGGQYTVDGREVSDLGL